MIAPYSPAGRRSASADKLPTGGPAITIIPAHGTAPGAFPDADEPNTNRDAHFATVPGYPYDILYFILQK